MVGLGPVWQAQDKHGKLGTSMVGSGPAWQDQYGRLRTSMVGSGPACSARDLHMVGSGPVWQAQDQPGRLGSSMVGSVPAWQDRVQYGRLRTSMVGQGPVWQAWDQHGRLGIVYQARAQPCLAPKSNTSAAAQSGSPEKVSLSPEKGRVQKREGGNSARILIVLSQLRFHRQVSTSAPSLQHCLKLLTDYLLLNNEHVFTSHSTERVQ